MRELWKKRSKRTGGARYLSVLDLGTSAVKAVVVELADGNLTIWGRGRSPALNAQQVAVRDVAALSASCEEALSDAEDATEAANGRKIVPDEVLIAVPTAWLRGGVGSGAVQRSAVEIGVVTEECYEPVMRAGRRAMRDLGRATGAGKWELVDAALASFSVDGHAVTDPLGFRGHLLEARVSVTAMPTSLRDALYQATEMLQLAPPYLVAEPLALAAASPGDGLIIDVGAHTTGMILVRHGAPLAFGGVPLGGAALTQALSETFAFSPSRAEALKLAYGADQLSPDGMSAVREALAGPFDVWLATASEHMGSWSEVVQVWPPEIYLCGGAGALSDISEVVSAARWLGLLPFPHSPQVRTWDGSTLSRVTDRADSHWQMDNVTTLAVAAWALRDRRVTTPDGMLCASLGIKHGTSHLS